MADPQTQTQEQIAKTIVIDNFSGEITPDLIGKLNSGKCPFVANTSGKSPLGTSFRQNGLQFNETIGSITGSTISAAITHTFQYSLNGDPYIYGVATDGSVYQIRVADTTTPTPDKDIATKFNTSVPDTLNYHGGFYDDIGNSQILVGTDSGSGFWYSISGSPAGYDPANSTWTVVTSGVTWGTNIPRPITSFLGNAYVGNGSSLVKLASNSQSVLNANILNPSIPSGWTISNLQVSNDGRYLIILVRRKIGVNDFQINLGPEPITHFPDSAIVLWNGSDAGFSSMQIFRGLNVVSIAQSSTDTIMFGKDIDGFGIFDLSGNLIARLNDIGQNGKSDKTSVVYPPCSYSIDSAGKLFFFSFQMGINIYIFMLDLYTQKLYSIFQDSRANSLSVIGGLCMASVHADANISSANTEVSRAKLYFFSKDLGSGTTKYASTLHLQNYGGNIAGAYTTQCEEFENKIQPIRVRVYLQPTVSGQSFNLKLFDSAFNVLDSTKTYTFAAGTDLTQAQGALTDVEFSISTKAVGSLMVNIVPVSSPALFIEKVEIGYLETTIPRGK